MAEIAKRDAPWLKDAAAKRQNATVKKLADAMKEMELDIQRNENIYPFNGGNVNQAEVCRRAGVAKTLLQGPAHKATTKLMVDKWVNDIRQRLVTGSRNIRKAVTARADDWQEQHKMVTTAYNIDMQRLEVANATIARLTAENEALRRELAKAGSNVRALSPRKKKAET